MKSYAERRAANEESLGGAEHHAERWSSEELEVLVACFTTDPEGLATLAEQLGRTVEACRQRYYLHQSGKTKASEKAEKKAAETLTRVNTWAGGFTSLEDMGY